MNVNDLLSKGPALLLRSPPRSRVVALRSANVSSAADLLLLRPSTFRKVMKGTSNEDPVALWQKANLVSVRSVSPAIADVLLNADILSVRQLAEMRLDALEEVLRANRSRELTALSRVDIAEILKEAVHRLNNMMLLGRVTNKTRRSPISDITIEIDKARASSDASGLFIFPSLAPGNHTLRLLLREHLLFTRHISIKSNQTIQTIQLGLPASMLRHKKPARSTTLSRSSRLVPVMIQPAPRKTPILTQVI